MWDHVIEAGNRLSAWHYLIILVNLALLALARPIVKGLGLEGSDRRLDAHVNTMRGLSLAILAIVGYYAANLASEESDSIVVKILSILVVLYLAYLATRIAGYWLRQRYGKAIKTKSGTQMSDSYRSRMLALLATLFIAIVALISIIRISEFDSLLEAGGVIGFIGVLLALTQSSWAPDIISGLILLNSDMVGEGDLIEIETPQPLMARVFKTKIFHTVLIDVVYNHRIMISNSRLRAYNIHSLSKFASARGLREKLVFKVGYDTDTQALKKMFNEAYLSVCEDTASHLDETHPLEIRVLETGDHAVEWGIFYYLKDISQLVSTRQRLIESILDASRQFDISLATPQTHQVTRI